MSSTREVLSEVQQWDHDCNPQPAPVDLARPVQQGHQTPCLVLQLGKLYGPRDGLDHGNLPLHHDRDVAKQRDAAVGARRAPRPAPVKLHNLHQKDVDHLVNGLQL